MLIGKRPGPALGLALIICWTPFAHAIVWNLEPDGTGDFATIQDAVDAAQPGDVIRLADGTYQGPRNRNVDYLGKDLTVQSASSNRDACVIDCENAVDAGFDFVGGEGAAAVLADLTITGCAGLALETQGSSPTLRNVVVRDGVIPTVDLDQGAPVLTGCLFESNALAPSGASAVTTRSADVTLEDCTFRSNTPGWGGRTVWIRGGTIDVRGCTFTDNLARALYLSRDTGGPAPDPEGTIQGSLFLRNRNGVLLSFVGAGGITFRNNAIEDNQGSGLHILAGNPVTVENCSIQRNVCGPGILFSTTSSSMIRSCTVSENGSDGISFPRGAGGNQRVEDCIIQGNAGSGVLTRGTGNPLIRNCLITGNAGGITAHSTSVTIEGCTISGNHLPQLPGAGVRSLGTNVDISSSVIWGNCSLDGSQISTYPVSTTNITCSNVQALSLLGSGGFLLTDVMQENPLFCAPTACAAAPVAGGIWGVSDDSPILGQACGTMGYSQSTCTALSSGANLEAVSWGWVKTRYR